ncbi:MAG: GNAT family N-acetyltransferase [Candidatus Saccharimonas sp.]
MASEIVLEQYNPNNPMHIATAEAISGWQEYDKTQPNYKQMFPLGPREIGQHIFGIVCMDIHDTGFTPVGYNGATYEFPGKVLETGGMIVNPDYRHRGLSKKIKAELLKALASLYPEYRLITFANESSEHLNRRCGFRDAVTADVPEQALELCAQTCTFYQREVAGNGKVCCDTILVRELGDLV